MELRAEVVMVDPDTAAEMRAKCHFERQRPISKGNVERLAYEMRNGWFIPATPVYICVLPDGTQKIANGNHTLEAVQAAGVEIPLTLIYAEVPDIEAVAHIYANMDLQKVRTWQNALQAVKGESSDFEGRVLAAVGLILNDFSPTAVASRASAISRTARLELFDVYRDAGQIIQNALLGAPKENYRLITRAGVLAVALYTARYQPSQAREFWHTTVMDDGLRKGDPRKALLKYLVGATGGNGSKYRTDMVKVSAAAWNANWREQEVQYFKPAVLELKMLGTPWHTGKPLVGDTKRRVNIARLKPKRAAAEDNHVN